MKMNGIEIMTRRAQARLDGNPIIAHQTDDIAHWVDQRGRAQLPVVGIEGSMQPGILDLQHIDDKPVAVKLLNTWGLRLNEIAG